MGDAQVLDFSTGETISAGTKPMSTAKKVGAVVGIGAAGVAVGVALETVLPVYISPVRGKYCPSEMERELAEEFRNNRRASKNAVKADKLLKKATRLERKGEYDKAERMANKATDLGNESDQQEKDAGANAGKRVDKILGLKKVAKSKLDTLRTLKDQGAPHPAEGVKVAAEGETKAAPAA